MRFSDFPGYSILIQLFFAAAVCYVCYYNWKRRHIYKTGWQLPGFFAYPIIGNAPILLKSNEGNIFVLRLARIQSRFLSETILDDLLRITDTYGTPSKFWLGSTLCVVISKPHHLEALMKNPYSFDKHDIYNFMKPCLREGLITSESNTTEILSFFFYLLLYSRRVEESQESDPADVQSKHTQHIYDDFRCGCHGTYGKTEPLRRKRGF